MAIGRFGFERAGCRGGVHHSIGQRTGLAIESRCQPFTLCACARGAAVAMPREATARMTAAAGALRFTDAETIRSECDYEKVVAGFEGRFDKAASCSLRPN
jgi:hypothetical protein